MSRIYEALKKAQQAGRAPEAEGTEAEGAYPMDSIAVPLEPVRTAGGDADMEIAQPGGSGEHPPFDGLALSQLPMRDWKPDPTRLIGHGSVSEVSIAEQFRTLRSRLLQIRSNRPVKKILVTSALPVEGKTFVSANLARMCARQHGRNVLLIDADLRASRLHETLGSPLAPGLTDYLTGNAEYPEVIQRGPIDNLYFVAGGSQVSNPAELIASGKLKRFLAAVAPLFEWIIIDSPPAVPVSDANVLAGFCDGVLLVVRAAHTPPQLAKKVCQEIKLAPFLGVVMNRSEMPGGYHSYYYNYYSNVQSETRKTAAKAR